MIPCPKQLWLLQRDPATVWFVLGYEETTQLCTVLDDLGRTTAVDLSAVGAVDDYRLWPGDATETGPQEKLQQLLAEGWPNP